ncbi:MAG TPA: hypothetical protein VGH81_12695 [Rudaea sp.]|jgi:hypothetical protein
MSASKLGSFSDLTLRKPDDAPKPAAAKRPAGKSRKKALDQADASSPPSPALSNETVKMTVKLTRADWERIAELRLSHRLPFQRVAIAGLNLFLKEMGQRPLQTSEGDEE